MHAAAGGVGSGLGQMARTLGAGSVVGSPTKFEYARGLGYDHVVLSDDKAAVRDFTGGRGADVVVDQVGGVARRGSLDLLLPGGRLVVMGNASGDNDDVPLSPMELWFAGKGVLGFNLQLASFVDPGRVGAAMQNTLNSDIRGEVRVDVTEVLPFTKAAEAHRRLGERRTTGKLVLRVRGDDARAAGGTSAG